MTNNLDDGEYQPPQTDKEVVVYKGDWGFRLPAQHRVLLSPDRRLVSLAIPDRGAIYHVDRIEETEDEFRIHVGGWYIGHGLGPSPSQYPFPAIQDELERLKNDYLAGGGRETNFNAWAQGASYGSRTEDLRAQIRKVRAGGKT